MASILRVNTITDASSNNSTAVSVINQGTEKAWFNFNGTDTVSLLDSTNVASMTDNGTGRYTGSLSNNMGNNNYCISCIGDYDGGSSVSAAHAATEHDNNSTSSFQYQSFRPSDNSYTDIQKAPAMIVGDLA